MSTALLIVDVQNDFCPGGTLATTRGDEVAGRVANLISGPEARGYSHILATQDWHIDPDSHFSDTPDFVDSWPVHCVAETDGASIRQPINTSLIDATFRKGAYKAAYSGFEGDSDGTALAAWLRDRGIDTLDICGIATDHCVRATVLDGLKEEFTVRVLRDLCSPVDEERGERALREMEQAGAKIA
ncbi:isochorismatase family protein [Corynebacterium sp. UBA2622]|uniref:isochorismatase family protein n=1 Tax=Corynebacterium sp. UBA2622 TaxID=1946393 RepID=UPI0025C5925D|nr:isochorismatase family protein [Corynebacterium sp. UBA2622]